MAAEFEFEWNARLTEASSVKDQAAQSLS